MAEKRLGKGLGSLLSPSTTRETIRSMRDAPGATAIHEIPVASVYPNRHQPRKTFDLETINELAASMESSGLISPIIVSPDEDGRYELVAGERRWRAACQLGWETIRAQVRTPDERERLELALIENVQREDLNAIDRAQAYHELMKLFDLTHEEVGKRIGKSRSTLTNLLRLLELPEDLQDAVRDGLLSAGHARALLAIEDDEERRELADQVVMDGLSVRALEKLVQGKTEPAERATATRKSRERTPQVKEMEDRLSKNFGTKVRIAPKGEGGRISIQYYNATDFERILEMIERGRG